MKKLAGNICKLSVIVLSLCMLYFGFILKALAPQYDTAYNAALLDKEARLLEMGGGKIILVGDSNLAYGIDSGMLEEQIGMPVVNMGLHGGLGNKMLERIAIPGIEEGDLVIICHSSYADEGDIEDPELVWVTIENYPELWKLLDAGEWDEVLPALPEYCLKTAYIGISGESVQCERQNFNEYGDYSLERMENIRTDDVKYQAARRPEVNEICISRLNELNRYCNERGARMLVAGYPIYTVGGMPDQQDIIDFENELKDSLECDVISTYTDYMYSYEFFYNTPLHLTNEGADLRTLQLIDDLKSYMATNP